jgi:hypothetical protein
MWRGVGTVASDQGWFDKPLDGVVKLPRWGPRPEQRGVSSPNAVVLPGPPIPLQKPPFPLNFS